jgi:membrane protease YdiL (CAAX protease family)
MDPDARTTAAASLPDKIALFIIITLPFTALFVNRAWMWLAVPLSLLVLAYFHKRNFAFFSLGFFWALFLLAILARLPWPFGFIIPLAVYLVVVAASQRVKGATDWIRRGSFNRMTLIYMAPTIIISSGALVFWAVQRRPDLSDLTRMMPVSSAWTLLAGGLLFSVFNAAWEEFILKGIMWNGLEKIFSGVVVINITQSLFFGLIHYQGFPRGV